MRILICDDDPTCRKEIKHCIENTIAKEAHELLELDSAHALLENKEMETCDMIFLDIEFEGEEQGIRASGKIHRQNPGIFIVLISAYFKYMAMGYRVGASRFILKGEQMREDIEEALNAAKVNLEQKYRPGIFDESGFGGYPDEVGYIESLGHSLELHLRTEGAASYRMRGKLDHSEEALKREIPGGFLRIHKSFLVNMDEILRLERYRVILRSGKELPVPKNRYREIQIAYLNERRIL